MTRAGIVRSLLIALLLVSSTGCATWSAVPLAATPRELPAVRVNDVVRVTRRGGTSTDLRVLTVWPDSVRGSMRFRPDSSLTLPWTEITRLERFDNRSGESLGALFGALLVVAVLRQSLDDTE